MLGCTMTFFRSYELTINVEFTCTYTNKKRFLQSDTHSLIPAFLSANLNRVQLSFCVQKDCPVSIACTRAFYNNAILESINEKTFSTIYRATYVRQSLEIAIQSIEFKVCFFGLRFVRVLKFKGSEWEDSNGDAYTKH